jgi:hypothetical protein
MKLYLVLGIFLLCGCASEDHAHAGLFKPKGEDLSSGQPTLRWVAEGGRGVTYDVVVYEVARPGPYWVPGRRVGYVEGVTATFYKLPEPLAPGDYCWSVRVRRGDTVERWRLRDRTYMYGPLLISAENQYARFRIPKR